MELNQENFQNKDAIQTASKGEFIIKDNYESNTITSNDKNQKEELFIFQNQNYYSKNQIIEINKEKKNNDSYKEGSINFETIIKMDEFNEQQNLLNNNQNKDFKIDNFNNQKSNQCLGQQPSQTKTVSNEYQHHHHHQSHSLNNHSLDLVFRSIYVSIPSNNSSNSKKTINEDSNTNKSKTFISKVFNKFLNKENLSKNIVEKKQLNPTIEIQTKRDILSNVSGYAKPGQLLAIMGPSGSGKTTLLNTLSGRLKARKGLVTVNGQDFSKQMKRKIGYVLQNDVFFAGLTLKQTLIYTALLRMPDSVSYVNKLKHVQHVIELLDLTDCEDTIIGDIMNRGLSGGEKKRASIACELLTNPSIMLLDEPTSGLDSSTAFNLMKSLKDYAIKENKTIIATIHQPSSQTFYLFDKLLLLVNGQMAYFGKANHVVPFFESLGYTISTHYNPADIMMEKIKQKEELPKILKAAKYLVKNCSVLSHAKGASYRRNSFKLNKGESQHDWSIVKLKVDLENNHQSFHHHHHHHINNHHHLASIEENPQSNYEIDVRNMINKNQFNGLEHNEKIDDLKDIKYKNRQYFNHSQQHHHLQKIPMNNTFPYEATEKDLCESCCKKNCKISFRLFNDDDSGRSSWIETDHSSTATFSSNNSCSSSTCSTEDVYSEVNFELENKSTIKTAIANDSSRSDFNHKSKWPTSFLTQVNVLTRRNFCESRHRMLSKLNWIQTIGLGILSGLMWFQLNRTESTLNDVRGFLFFSISYWMLFAWFGALISIQPEREIMNKERSSGAYRLSAFYLAKMIGELPLIITLPSLYFFICYPMFAINLNINNFLLQWFFMILSALVAQSIGLFIGLATMSLEISVTVSAIYSTAISLFGGYYSASLPYWLGWMRYTSILYYAFQNMQAIEFSYGGPIRCADTNSKYSYCLKQIASLASKVIDNNSIQLLKNNQSIIESTKQNIANDSINDANFNDQNLFIPYNELISELNGNGLSMWSNIGILICFLCFFRVMGYLVLRFVHTPK